MQTGLYLGGNERKPKERRAYPEMDRLCFLFEHVLLLQKTVRLQNLQQESLSTHIC
ncbi:hypothetical protein [Desmospora activa]|uniref:Uncharacterized protein n=1 Tax=Desmospora activa DSM 45169 TaxID=1121389 RepID=A0A2T4ZDK6_9BACL|nr:hypothetical protein [Desmospora activa]PTM59967.1 hypothetical protein C8J48_2606 [Desmospora activa DSM 45169]